MSAREFCDVVHALVADRHNAEQVDDLLWPPTLEERRAEHAAELRAAGIPVRAMG